MFIHHAHVHTGLLLSVLLHTRRLVGGTFSDKDLWSGKIWNVAQRARDQHASNSDRLMQHMWQQPDLADKFVDCDIVADSETDKNFVFLNRYDMDAERDTTLSALPDDGFARDLWPLNEDSFSTVYYHLHDGLDPTTLQMFRNATDRWQDVVTVKFVDKGNAKKAPPNMLNVVAGAGCFTTLGYHATNLRQLTLLKGRCTEDVIVHLLGHVLGLPHPTSAVGSDKDYYVMPHHAAPRSFGMLRSRTGYAINPFDIMGLDPWFCAVSNRSTWRPRSPAVYKHLSVAGAWFRNASRRSYPERFSSSVILLQKQLRQEKVASQCKDPAACDGTCQKAVSSDCLCLNTDAPFADLDRVEFQSRCLVLDMSDVVFLKTSEETSLALDNMMEMTSHGICIIYHSTDSKLEKGIAPLVKCWQCTIFSFKITTSALFGDGFRKLKQKESFTEEQVKQFRLIALGSRCTLFSLEVNGPLEESWYRLCMHHLVDSGGELRLAWRGPGTLLMRYYSSADHFPEFHKAFWEEAMIGWTVSAAENCDCDADVGDQF